MFLDKESGREGAVLLGDLYFFQFLLRRIKIDNSFNYATFSAIQIEGAAIFC